MAAKPYVARIEEDTQDKRLAEILAGSTTTPETAIKDYAVYLHRIGRKTNTIRGYVNILTKVIDTPLFPSPAAHALSILHSLDKSKIEKRTKAHHLGIIRNFLEWAARRDVGKAWIVDELQPPPGAQANKQVPNAMSFADQRAMMKYALEPYSRKVMWRSWHRAAFLLLSLHASCRFGEARWITRAEISFKTKEIRLRHNHARQLKTAWSERDIPASPSLLIFLEKCCEGLGPQSLVFPGSCTTPPYVYRASEKLGKSICNTLLRHTFASFLINSGVSDLRVADLMGHASPKMTYKHYRSRDQVKIVDLEEGWFVQSKETAKC